MRPLILQSFREFDVPTWVRRCQESVIRYAASMEWDYAFLGDEFFDLAPPWAIKRLKGGSLCTLSDICRLEWMQKEFEEREVVLWADIDILVIDPSAIQLDLEKPFGFSYELYFDQEGAHHGLNNAFMFFHQNAKLFRVYMERCYEILRNRGLGRTAMGPDLLRELNVPADHVIQGVNILNFATLCQTYKDRQIPGIVRTLSHSAIGAANLCLNQRSSFSVNDRARYDALVDDVSKLLLKGFQQRCSDGR